MPGMTSEAKAIVADIIENVMAGLVSPADKLKIYLPANLENYDDLDDGGHILVLYKGSRYSDNKVSYAVNQNREITISVTIESLSVPGRMLPEDYLDAIISGLINYEMTVSWRQPGKRITVSSDELMGENNGRWRYILEVSVPATIFSGGTI